MKPLPETLSAELDPLLAKLGCKSVQVREAAFIMCENLVLMEGKQADYGTSSVGRFGLFGVVVRMTDKFERIRNLFNQGRRRRAINESIRDSFRDVANYAIIALMIEKGTWPDADK